MSAGTARTIGHHEHGAAGERGDRSLRIASVVAGTGLLAMALLAAFGNFAVVERLVTPGDPAQTAQALLDNEGTFRLGVASFYLVAALDLVVAAALYRLLRLVSPTVSTVAAWFRVGHAAVFLAAIGQLATALGPLTDPTSFAGLTQAQRSALAMSKVEVFEAMWSAGLALFGIHLLLVGYLLLSSQWRVRWVGIVVAIAGAGYLIDSLAEVLLRTPPFELALVTFVGELVLMFWLLIRGGLAAARRTG